MILLLPVFNGSSFRSHAARILPSFRFVCPSAFPSPCNRCCQSYGDLSPDFYGAPLPAFVPAGLLRSFPTRSGHCLYCPREQDGSDYLHRFGLQFVAHLIHLTATTTCRLLMYTVVCCKTVCRCDPNGLTARCSRQPSPAPFVPPPPPLLTRNARTFRSGQRPTIELSLNHAPTAMQVQHYVRRLASTSSIAALPGGTCRHKLLTSSGHMKCGLACIISIGHVPTICFSRKKVPPTFVLRVLPKPSMGGVVAVHSVARVVLLACSMAPMPQKCSGSAQMASQNHGLCR